MLLQGSPRSVSPAQAGLFDGAPALGAVRLVHDLISAIVTAGRMGARLSAVVAHSRVGAAELAYHPSLSRIAAVRAERPPLRRPERLIDCDPAVEDEALTFEPVRRKLFEVPQNTSLEVEEVAVSAPLHLNHGLFASDSPGAVHEHLTITGDLFPVEVFSELLKVVDAGIDRPGEFAERRLVPIAGVEERQLLAALEQGLPFCGGDSARRNSLPVRGRGGCGNPTQILQPWTADRDDLRSNAYFEAREGIRVAEGIFIAPLAPPEDRVELLFAMRDSGGAPGDGTVASFRCENDQPRERMRGGERFELRFAFRQRGTIDRHEPIEARYGKRPLHLRSRTSTKQLPPFGRQASHASRRKVGPSAPARGRYAIAKNFHAGKSEPLSLPMTPLLLRSLAGETIPRPPVWLMRQAGRYLTEYQAVKARHAFLEMCRSPELATEVTMQPIRILDPDAAIIFADILLPAEGMGFGIDFAPGPKIHNPVRMRSDIEALRIGEPERDTPFVLAALRQVRSELAQLAGSGERKALLGFAGAPWTMACYLIDQTPFKHFERTPILAAQDPAALAMLLEKITATTEQYLLAQCESGADAVQLFESWGGILPEDDYRRYALPYVRRIVETVHRARKPIILYANGSHHLLGALADAGADCVSIDSRTPLAAAEARIGDAVSLQGNLDPAHLFGSPETVAREVEQLLYSLERRTRFILNLGHGILQQTPRESVIAFVDAAKAGWPAP